MGYNWQFNKELGLYRAGCGCRMRIENQDEGLKQRLVKVCKRHQQVEQ